jgi:hypothetical protein
MTVNPQITENDNKTNESVQDAVVNVGNADQTQPVAGQTESTNEINWRKFRQEREKERKEKEEAEKRAAKHSAEASAMKAAMEAMINSNKATPSAARDEEEEESEEARIDRKVMQALERQKQSYEKERQEREKAELPQTLQKTYPDFNNVCTTENLDYLEFHYPEVIAGYKDAKDSVDKWANVYKLVKRFVPNTDSKRDVAKMEKNLAKPQSMSVSGVTQTGDQTPVNNSDKKRQDNWARMQRVMKGL